MTAVDEGVLADLGRDLGDASVARQVVELYLTELPRRRSAVQQGAAAGDLAVIQREAHALGSASALVGGLQLQAACRALESLPPGTAIGPDSPLVVEWSQIAAVTASDLGGWLARTP